MEDKKNNVLKFGLIALVILNLILLSRIYFSDHHPPHHHEKHERPDEFVIRELKLSDEQVQKYQQLIKHHRDSVKMLKEEGRKFREDFFSQLKTGSMNPQLKSEFLSKIGDNQKKIEDVTFNHFSSLRLILNSGQKSRFDQIIDDVLLKLSHQNSPPF